MKRYGLVGFPLSHSFSKKYFEEKFTKMGIQDTHRYDLFEMEYLKDFPSLWDRYPDLMGVNITIPHKVNILRFLDQLDPIVHKTEAVNVIKRKNGKLVGYNSDFLAFKDTLETWLKNKTISAVILGTGGASKAVQTALDTMKIDYEVVSRSTSKGDFTYTRLFKDPEILKNSLLIINTTPLGMYPDIDDAPPIPYEQISAMHYCYDLIYNPSESMFLKECAANGARIKNGLEMLHKQAEIAWEIWNS